MSGSPVLENAMAPLLPASDRARATAAEWVCVSTGSSERGPDWAPAKSGLLARRLITGPREMISTRSAQGQRRPARSHSREPAIRTSESLPTPSCCSRQVTFRRMCSG